MSWRKWFVRSLVFSVVGLCTCAAYLYQHWTNPAAVRQEVVAKLEEYFPGATVTLDSARLRILGGVVLSELRLARRDDPEKLDIAHIPSATFYHDKEKLMDGTVILRKIELDRPRLRLARGSDGKWNLEGISGPLQPHLPIPTIVIHQGTLVLDDRMGGANLPTMEITNVSLTLINDPLTTVNIDGRAHSELAGDLEVHGSWNRGTKELALSAQVQGVHMTPALLQRVTSSFPTGVCQQMSLEGIADFKADLAYMPGATPPFSYDVSCRLTKGKLRHARLPLPLDDLDASLRCCNGQMQLKSFKARSGPSEVFARGTAFLPSAEVNFEGLLEIKHLELCNGLFERLPESFQAMNIAFEPAGPASLRVACARRGGKWAPLASGAASTVSLIPENMNAAFQKFPYPLERLTGSLDFNLLTERITVDVTGYTGPRPVMIKGTWTGKGIQADAKFDIHATDVPLDEKLLSALRFSPFEKLARSFHANGKGDIKAFIRHVPGAAHFANEYHVRFHDSDVQWEQFPFHLTELTGFLDIYPNHWEFHDFQGRHHDGLVCVQGKTNPDDGSGKLVIDLSGRNVVLDNDLKRAFAPHPALTKTWEVFSPTGMANFSATIERPMSPRGPDPEKEVLDALVVRVEVQGGTIEPHFFPFAFHELTGKFLYHKNRVEVTGFTAKHEGAQVRLKSASVDIHPNGGIYADLKELQAQDLKVDEDFLKALPVTLKSPCKALELKDPLLLKTDLIVAMGSEPGSPPDIYWDGQMWLSKARLKTGLELKEVTGTLACRGRHWQDQRGRLLAMNGNVRFEQATLLKQPFHDVEAHFQVRDGAPEVLAIGLKAPLYGGDISGQIRLEMSSSLRYELNMTASQINLEEFGRHNLGPNHQLQGIAVGRLHLTGQGSGADTLDGNGRLDMPRGHIKNLPLLLDLLKFLGLRWPDRTLFDEARAIFNVHGQKVRVERLELIGNAISLYGNGDFKLDGTDVKLDFYPSWGRFEKMVPPALRSIPAEIGKSMLKIETRGQVSSNPDDLKFTKKPIPALIDPLLYMRDKMSGSK